jgi:hypothetical protein
MKRNAVLEFSELKEKVEIELDDSQSPQTVRAIVARLPISVAIERWGDELYSKATPVKAEEENAKSEVALFDVAYWPDGSALCFFYGPTPVIKKGRIPPYSPVNVIGTIKSRPANVAEFLRSVEGSHVRKKILVTLRLQ